MDKKTAAQEPELMFYKKNPVFKNITNSEQTSHYFPLNESFKEAFL